MNLNVDAIKEYIACGHTFEQKTFIKEQPFIPEHLPTPELNLQKNIKVEDVQNALLKYFGSFKGKRVIVMLSGGKDSRYFAETCKNLGIDTTAMTVGFSEDSRECQIAKMVSDHLGIPHKFLPIKEDMYSLEFINQVIAFGKHGPLDAPMPYHLYYKDILSQYDAIFIGDHLTLPLRESRFYYPKDDIKRLLKETRLDWIMKFTGSYFSSIVTKETREELTQLFTELNQGQTINEMMHQKVKETRFLRFDRTNELFPLRCPAIDNSLLSVMWSFPKDEVIKKIMSKYRYSTYGLPCTRSPLPLKYNWILHEGYKYMLNVFKGFRGGSIGNADMGYWCGGQNFHIQVIRNRALELGIPDSLPFNFLDKEKIREQIKAMENGCDHVKGIERLVLVAIWYNQVQKKLNSGNLDKS